MGAGLNKVRGRKGYINKESYNKFIKSDSYKKKYKEVGEEIPYKLYIRVLKTMTEEIANCILDNELGFKLPYKLGHIAVTKFKQKSSYKVTDWKNSNTYGKIIPILNLHSYNWMFKIKLFRPHSVLPLNLYCFKAHRVINRALAQKIKSGKYSYNQLDTSYFNKKYRIDNIFKNKKQWE